MKYIVVRTSNDSWGFANSEAMFDPVSKVLAVYEGGVVTRFNWDSVVYYEEGKMEDDES